jgi:hypothetical protein
MKAFLRSLLRWRGFDIFRRNRVKPEPWPEPPNPFSPEQTPKVFEFLDDALVTSLVASDANNDKQLDWCLAITGSIITAVIVSVILHPASQHPPFLSGFTRIFLFVLLLSTLLGVWAKVSMTGNKPDVVSLRSPALEKLLESFRPQGSPFNLDLLTAQAKYLSFHLARLQGKVYTNQPRNTEALTTLLSIGGERASATYSKAVRFKANLINVQLCLAIIGVTAITMGIVCRLRI